MMVDELLFVVRGIQQGVDCIHRAYLRLEIASDRQGLSFQCVKRTIYWLIKCLQKAMLVIGMCDHTPSAAVKECRVKAMLVIGMRDHACVQARLLYSRIFECPSVLDISPSSGCMTAYAHGMHIALDSQLLCQKFVSNAFAWMHNLCVYRACESSNAWMHKFCVERAVCA